VSLAELRRLLESGARLARPVLYCNPDDLDGVRWAADQLPPAWKARAEPWAGSPRGTVVVAWEQRQTIATGREPC
jgi:hypothetical protein